MTLRMLAVLLVLAGTVATPYMYAAAAEASTTPQQQVQSTTANQGGEPTAEQQQGNEGNEQAETAEGASGTSGSSSDETLITTGDSNSSADVHNEQNTNKTELDVQTASSGPSTADDADTATDTPQTQSAADENEGDAADEQSSAQNSDNQADSQSTPDDTVADGGSGQTDAAGVNEMQNQQDGTDGTQTGTTTAATTTATTTTVSNTNIASSTNRVIVDGNTGTNTATSSGDAAVRTGDSIASANVVNVVNSNIFNSHGAIMLMNWLMGSRSLDLRDIDFGGSTLAGDGQQRHSESTATRCSLSSCDDESVQHTVVSSSTASITNDVVVRSQTGRNRVHASGTASVHTGDAYSSANVVNVANSNFVNSNYLLLSLNNFGNLAGDVIFPGSQFFSRFLSRGAGTGTTTVTNENRADISNNVAVSAETGSNTASSTSGTSTVSTGSSIADSSVTNQINTNSFGGEEVFILFKVHGNWSGNIFGLPDGISWERTPQGIKIFSSDAAGGSDTTATSSATGTDPMSRLTVSNKNKATISNNVGVYALTGENEVTGGTGASVETGNAHAAANVVNMANTNVVGRNWMFAIFNIFGNFEGDIAFGRPDLWLGMRAQSPDTELKPGSPLTYKYTIANRGDSPATDVQLSTTYNDKRVRFTDDAGSGRDGRGSWDIGRLDPGETRELTRDARIADRLPRGDTPVQVKASVTATQPDENEIDNSDELSMLVRRGNPSDGSHRGDDDGDDGIHGSPTDSTSRADLSVEKEANYAFTKASSTVQYTIEIENHGGYAYNSILIDTLRNEEGEIINQQRWPLGEILPDEDIEVTYSVFFNASTTPGTYTNSAIVRANDQYRDPNLGFNADSNAAEAKVDIVERLPGEAVPKDEREAQGEREEGIDRTAPEESERDGDRNTNTTARDTGTPESNTSQEVADEQPADGTRPIADNAIETENNQQPGVAGSRNSQVALASRLPYTVDGGLTLTGGNSLASVALTQTTTPLAPQQRTMLASTFVADLSYRQWSVMVLMLALLLVLLMLFRRVEREHTERE